MEDHHPSLAIFNSARCVRSYAKILSNQQVTTMKSVKLTCGLFLVLCLVRPITSGNGPSKRVIHPSDEMFLWNLVRTDNCGPESIDAWIELARKSPLEWKANVHNRAGILIQFASRCYVIDHIGEEFEKGRKQVDKSALNIEQLLSDDVITAYKEENGPDFGHPDKSFGLIESSFAAILEKEPTAFELKGLIVKYLSHACQDYTIKMQDIMVITERMKKYLGHDPFCERQSKPVQYGVFRYIWCYRLNASENLRCQLEKRLWQRFNPQNA